MIESDIGRFRRAGVDPSDADYRARYEALKKQFAVKENLTDLQAQRPSELEREIWEQAPELARRLGLED